MAPWGAIANKNTRIQSPPPVSHKNVVGFGPAFISANGRLKNVLLLDCLPCNCAKELRFSMFFRLNDVPGGQCTSVGL